MKLEQLINHPLKGFVHSERYVNITSPFTLEMLGDLHPNYSAMLGLPEMNLYVLDIPKGELEIVRSDKMSKYIGEIFTSESSDKYVCHPQVFEQKLCRIVNSLRKKATNISKISAQPTASNRTMLVDSGDYQYLVKTHFPGRISSNNRNLSKDDISEGVAVTNELYRLSQEGKMPQNMGFHAESFGASASLDGDSAGFIVREYLSTPSSKTIQLPLISLFVPDTKNLKDPLLVEQIASLNNTSVDDYLVEKVVKPHISHWKWLISNVGIIPNLHGQNVVLGYNSNFDNPLFSYRDFQGKKRLDNFGKYDLFEDSPITDLKKVKLDLSLSLDFMMGYLFYDRVLHSMEDRGLIYKGIKGRIQEESKKIIGEYKDFMMDNEVHYEGIGNERRISVKRNKPKYR